VGASAGREGPASICEGYQAFLAALQSAEDVGHLGVDMLEPSLRNAVLSAMKQMCIGILDGRTPSSIRESLPGDQITWDIYHAGIKELLATVEAAEREFGR